MTEQNPLDKQLVDALLSDRRSDRRWRNVRFLVWVILLLIYAILIFSPKQSHSADIKKHPYVAMVKMQGVIMPQSSFSAHNILPALQKAFSDKQAKGVVLLINSPGGSPVQASIIHDKILQLKKQYHKKVVVVGEDTLASGAYLVSSAADKIYVNPDTLTGSIGVIMSSFGFNDAIHKLGITRRVYTAGVNKDRLDPFKPTSKADEEKIQSVLNVVHQHFINDVIQGRKGKLRGKPSELFSGDFWSGSQAEKLGLVDGTANLWTVMQKEFKVTHYINYSKRPSFISMFFHGAEEQLKLKLGSDMNSPQLQAVMANH